ncbi:MAG: hypothetical protein K1X53_17380 [Candidatus Sumerlaeaceae bacterium]|nr:hypothetical protein [Candidatus Sumerlaeaceae bacterium]
MANIPVLRDRKPVIDGRVTEQESQGAAVVSMNILGGLDKPRNPTKVMMFFTQNALYVGFICTDSTPDTTIARTQKENGPVFSDDSVQLFVTPEKDGTRTNYFHFAVNAAGVRYSMDMSKDAPVPNWTSAVQHTQTGWEAEMLIPFSSVKGNLDGDFWRGNVARFRAGREGLLSETSSWINTGTTLHNFRRLGYLAKSDPLAPKVVRSKPQETTSSADGGTTK